MTELMPCPFCGTEPYRMFFENNGDGEPLPMGKRYCSVYCSKCGSSTMFYRSMNEAIEAWNRRVKNDKRSN